MRQKRTIDSSFTLTSLFLLTGKLLTEEKEEEEEEKVAALLHECVSLPMVMRILHSIT